MLAGSGEDWDSGGGGASVRCEIRHAVVTTLPQCLRGSAVSPFDTDNHGSEPRRRVGSGGQRSVRREQADDGGHWPVVFLSTTSWAVTGGQHTVARLEICFSWRPAGKLDRDPF